MKKLKHITKVCQEIYEQGGQSAVFEYIYERKSKNLLPYVNYKYCKGCETECPVWEYECLVCGGRIELKK